MNEVKSSRPTDLGMADESLEHPPFLGRELYASNAELNKRRKLQYEVDNLGLPWPKQKYRDHFSSSAHEFLNFNSTKNDGPRGKEITSGEIHNKLGQSEESDNNSNNSSTVDDNGIMLDLQAKEEKSIFLHSSQSASSHTSGHVISNKATEGGTPDLQSTSLHAPGHGISNKATEGGTPDLQSTSLHAPGHTISNKMTVDGTPDLQSTSSHASGHAISNKATEDGTPNSDEMLQYEPRENATGNGLGANYIDGPEIAQYEMECWNAAQDDIMLYSNDVAPFLFSSERRKLGQDSQTKSPKPTIDQEFEQYFSMFKH